MVSFNPDSVVIEITKQEQMAMLQYCNLNDDIRQMLFSAQGTVTLTSQQAADLRRMVDAEFRRAGNTEAKDALASVFNKLSPNPIMREISEKLSGMNIENMDQMQAEVEKMINHYNAQLDDLNRQNNVPDPALGGLSPLQVHDLLYFEWDEPECPLKLNETLCYDDVKDVTIYKNSVILLEELNKMAKLQTATAKGNLGRKVVRSLIEKFDFKNDRVTEFLTGTYKNINEPELIEIFKVRLICQDAGLIRKSKNKFLVTKKGNDLLAAEKAGKLYHLLFFTYFREINISFFDRLPEFDDLQATLPYSLYRVGKIAAKEVQLKKAYRKIILPPVMEEVADFAHDLISLDFIIKHRVIEPLEFAGLLDCKYEVQLWPEMVAFKVSELFRKFVRFEF